MRAMLFLVGATLALLGSSGCGNSLPDPGEQIAANPIHGIEPDPVAKSAPNFLILIGDDMGVETLSAYGVGESTAVTPHLDALAERGVRFEQFWSQPICSPTRAALLTGRYEFRTGVTAPLFPYDHDLPIASPDVPDHANKSILFMPFGPIENIEDQLFEPPLPLRLLGMEPAPLPMSELTLPQILRKAGYATGAVGKWHLADPDNGWLAHPHHMGFEFFSGVMSGALWNFWAWPKLENGEMNQEQTYIDDTTVAAASRWIAEQDRPWYMTVNFINPHSPVHLPPTDLLSSDARNLDPDALSEDNVLPYFLAQIEAMDTLIGRLLDGLAPTVRDNTIVVFLGDNGTGPEALPNGPIDPSHGKGTVYQGGVLTPMIVAGPGVAGGRTSDALVHVTDFFPTILGFAGLEAGIVPEDLVIDGVDFSAVLRDPRAPSARTWNYAGGQLFMSTFRTIRDDRFKLVDNDGDAEFYDLYSDPFEKTNLLGAEGGPSPAASAALARLEGLLTALDTAR